MKTLNEPVKNLAELINTMNQLLSPQGCPWDREQTHKTLTRHLLEESYEVIDAINNNDMRQLQEELGDVLLQVVFHAALAEREGFFGLADVIETVNHKMINRHPHVFGDLNLSTSSEVLDHWEGFKKKEGKKKILEGIPAILPALLRATKIQEKAAQVGFDFPEFKGAKDKLEEEILELSRAADDMEALEELGDVLFSLVNIARLKCLEPEKALQISNDKFSRRFNYIEESLIKMQKEFKETSLEELDQLWEEAKRVSK